MMAPNREELSPSFYSRGSRRISFSEISNILLAYSCKSSDKISASVMYSSKVVCEETTTELNGLSESQKINTAPIDASPPDSPYETNQTFPKRGESLSTDRVYLRLPSV
jgi:hypothetical protein